MQLIDEEPFGKITINDIVTLAEVNRSTFYSHYPDIFALLNDCLKAGVVLDNSHYVPEDIVTDPEKHIMRTRQYLEFCFNHSDMYLKILSEFQTNAYLADYYETILELFCQMQKALLPRKTPALISEKLIARYVLAGQAGLIRSWLLKKPKCSLEKLAWIHDIVQIRAMCCLSGCDVPEWVTKYERSNVREDY